MEEIEVYRVLMNERGELEDFIAFLHCCPVNFTLWLITI
jgi:hypothetical protein